MADIPATCNAIKAYSPCDISDALLILKAPGAGHLADIHPNPNPQLGKTTRLVAPISTVLFVPNTFVPSSMPSWVPSKPNLPTEKHWTDVPAAGSVAVMKIVAPSDHEPIIAGLLGDIVATRYKTRGVLGAIVDGRSRDAVGCAKLEEFQVWSKGLTSVGTSLQAKPWAVDIPMRIGSVMVNTGDILCADEAERVIAVIPRNLLQRALEILPGLKKADDEVLTDVERGIDLKTSFAGHPEHYTQRH